MQLDRQPGRPSRRENLPRLLGREPDVLLAERIDRVGQPLARDRREHVVADGGDVGVLVAVRFRRQRMGAEERRHDRHRPLDAEPARGAQQAGLGVEIEPVTGLDLDRGDALGDQPVEARGGARDELVLARRPRRLDGRDDAAAGRGDLAVARAG